MDVIYERCAGLVIGKNEVAACLRTPGESGRRRQEIRTYPTFTAHLQALADWLTAEQVTQVVGASALVGMPRATSDRRKAREARHCGPGAEAAVGVPDWRGLWPCRCDVSEPLARTADTTTPCRAGRHGAKRVAEL